MGDDLLRRELDELLLRSAAGEPFRAAVRAFAADARTAAIVVPRVVPRLKVLRLLAQLLDAEPALRPVRAEVDARSGCSDLRGTLSVIDEAGVEHRWRFVWDCRWRAEEEGLRDRWGQPDQVRAAREYGWRCFAEWRRT